MFKSLTKQRAEAEARVKPKGCEGQVSTEVEVTGQPNRGGTNSGVGLKYNITTRLGCAGLRELMVDVRTGQYVRATDDTPNRERQRFEISAILESGASIVAACADCPLGYEYQRRQTAELMRAQPDELQPD